MSDQKEQNEEAQEEIELTKADYTFLPKGNHLYRQQGYYLVCKSCDIQHAVWIGSEKILVGFDEKNEAILKNRKDIMR